MNINIISYNILANHLVSDQWFHMSDKNALDNTYRINLLKTELIRMFKYNTIICLQEVSSEQLDEIDILIQNFGYKYVYFAGDYISGGVMGLCIMYPMLYKLIRTKREQIIDNNIDIILQTALNKYRRQILMVELFDHKLKKKFVIATTHLLANPKFESIKLLQAIIVNNKVSEFAGHKPIVLAGDFNSVYDSDIYKFIINRKPNNKFYLKINHKIQFKNVFAHIPEFTNYAKTSNNKETFIETIDHIFINEGFRVIKTKKMPSTKDIKYPSLPSLEHSSDHIPIGAQLQLV